MTSQEGMNQLAELMDEIKKAREVVVDGDAARNLKIAKMEAALNALSLKVGRHGGNGSYDATEDAERRSALDLLQLKHVLRQPKHDPGGSPFVPDEPSIAEASLAVRGFKHLLQTTDIASMPVDERRALTSFNVGSSGFILPVEMSTRTLSCLVEKSDITGLMSNVTISGPGIKFLVDNTELDNASFSCQADCWSADHVKNLTAGLGEIEIRPETLRYVVCASRDILEDASFDVEQWVLKRVDQAFRRTINQSVLTGTGVGMPIGILNPNAGVPVCDTAPSTPPNMFTWQDLIMLKWAVPQQYHPGRYLMNQWTFGLLLTMSDSSGRPIMLPSPVDSGSFTINGSPVTICTQMPDVVAGSTPVMFANFESLYLIVTRKAVTMLHDPYSAGFCILLKFEARVGGAVICPNAGRLLRIR